MDTITFDVVKEATTKRFVKYVELATSYIGSLYISKETFDGAPPDELLTVTIAPKRSTRNSTSSKRGT